MRANGHFVLGAFAGAAVGAMNEMAQVEKNPGRQFDVWTVLGCALVGGTAALIPDILEPAVHPDHRRFFHSVTSGSGVAWLLGGPHTSECSPGIQVLLASAAMGYLSHLAADACTPNSIRFL